MGVRPGPRVPGGWWVAGLLVALVTAVSWLTVEARRDSGGFSTQETWSTTSPAPGGTRALFLALEEGGQRPSRLRVPWTELPPEVEVLVVPPPLREVSREEWEALEGWLRAGGRLVFVPAPWDPGGLKPGFPWQAVEVAPGPGLLEGVRRLEVPLEPRPRRTLAESGAPRRVADAAVTLLQDGDRPLLARAQRGRGSVVVLQDPELLGNLGILRGDNARLALNLVAGARPGGVAFDEYHLGQGAGEAGTLWNELPLATRRGFQHLLLALALLAWAVSRRRGGVMAPPEAARQRSEYLESMAGLLQRAGAGRLVARTRRKALAEALDRALGLPPGGPDEPRAAALRERDPRLAREAEELLGGFDALAAGRRPSPEALLALARREGDLVRRVREGS